MKFDPQKHIKNVFDGSEVSLCSNDGTILPGISGVEGAIERMDTGAEVGVDRIIMDAGSEFELHTHPGAHILYVIRSCGYIHVDGVDYEMATGDTVYVPADYVHGVKTDCTSAKPLELLAFGVPHMPLESAARMIIYRS